MAGKRKSQLVMRMELRDDTREGKPTYAVVDRHEGKWIILSTNRAVEEKEGGGMRFVEPVVLCFTRKQAVEVATALLNAHLTINEKVRPGPLFEVVEKSEPSAEPKPEEGGGSDGR